MIFRGVLSFIFLFFTLFLSTQALAITELRVISDRTPSHLESLFKYYEQQSGVKIKAVFVKKGLIARLKSRPTEANLVITNTADLLEQAKQQDLLQAYNSGKISSALKSEFQDPDNNFITLSYRPRSIFTSKNRVKPDEVLNYEDLLDPKWKGRICIRSGYHQYNLNLFSQIAADKGLDYTRTFLTGLHANLARKPNGNDRAQVRGIYENQCDLSIGNSYYMPLMLSNEKQRPWGESSRLIFPDQSKGGAYILLGGAGLTKASDNLAEATRFMEFLVSDEAQNFITNTTYEYPVNDTVALPDAVRTLGKDQPEVSSGRFKAKIIPLSKIAEIRPEIVKILDEINFDNK